MSESERSLFHRFLRYQRERFPFLAHAPLISTFALSAASYSFICRQGDVFLTWPTALIGAFTAVTFFFLLRVSDEFKDRETDALHRPYLPVPRGLIQLRELKQIALANLVLVLILNAVFLPRVLPLLLFTLLFLWWMRYEFGMRNYLRENIMAYMWSHMLIMPVFDFYATGLDWMQQDVAPDTGLVFFLAASYGNGLVVEWGRKLRSPKGEEKGVDTYSSLFGPQKAGLYWLAILTCAWLVALGAAQFASLSLLTHAFLTVLYLSCAIPALRYVRTQGQRSGSGIEKAAAIWTFGMYLSLGIVPFLNHWMP